MTRARRLVFLAVLFLTAASLACQPTGEATATPAQAALPTEEQPTVAQPTVAQPTAAQPTAAQPTAVQPTVAQPTPAPTQTLPQGLAILSFTVDVEELPPAGKRLTFHWQTTGASSGTIWSGTQQRFPQAWAAEPVQNGSLTVELVTTYYRNPPMTLVARDAADNSVSESVIIEWPCQYPYFFPTDIGLCAASAADETWAAEQSFENGRMIWLEEVSSESTTYQHALLVLYADGRFAQYEDTWTEGEPESDPTIVPPAGLYQPIRGFGKLWRTVPAVRDGLGWASGPEQGFNTTWQLRISESIPSVAFVRSLDGQIIQIDGWGWESGGSWQTVSP